MNLFMDLDGVLADFDSHHEAVFGVRPVKREDVDWDAVTRVGDFFLRMPPMRDSARLWKFARRYHPIILTSVPRNVAEAPDNKRAWVRRHLGSNVEVRCVRGASTKCEHAQPGDILVDDWERHRQKWLDRGGVWVTHRSARGTIAALRVLGL